MQCIVLTASNTASMWLLERFFLLRYYTPFGTIKIPHRNRVQPLYENDKTQLKAWVKTNVQRRNYFEKKKHTPYFNKYHDISWLKKH